jgi:murein DD-endopeptidase MepM/ murein hydrolase activator NlpD
MKINDFSHNWLYKSLYLAFSILLCTFFVNLYIVRTSATPAISNTIETLKQEKEQINQQRQDVLRESQRLRNLQEAAENRLNGLQYNLRATQANIQDSEYRIKIASERLQQLQSELAKSETLYLDGQAATIARLRVLQRSPVSQGWAVLLQSQNLSDFLTKRRQLKLVYQADQKILLQLSEEANRLIKQKAAVEAQKNEVAIIRQQLLAQKSDYQGASELQGEMIQRLNGDRLALDAAQSQLERDSQELTSLIQQKVAEARAREAAAKANSSKDIFVKGSGIMGFPSDAPLSSSFGWRVHPVLGYRRFHSGLDFAGNYGSTIRAADSGTVIFAGWYGGYGKAVIIDHGKGITTLYGHTSELYISEGQVVKRGMPIAAVGTTGLSTGPHLHFEVRKDGNPVDPASYL